MSETVCAISTMRLRPKRSLTPPHTGDATVPATADVVRIAPTVTPFAPKCCARYGSSGTMIIVPSTSISVTP